MASASNNKDKTPSEDDLQDPKLKEEVESEAEEEEIEEEQRSCTHSVVASIGVVTNPSKFKRSTRISTRGGVPRHTLAPRTSSLGKESSKCEEGWVNNSKSWDSPPDMLMSRVEHTRR
jgi:hypothetical protein